MDEANARPDSSRSVSHIYEELRSAIIRVEIDGGASMSQVDLAKRLGTGRAPLREALRMLRHEGLVVSEPHRRVQIAGFSAADLEDLEAARIALENTSVRYTVPYLQPEDLAAMEGYMAQMEHYFDDRDFDRLEVPHRAFHQLLVSRAGPVSRRLSAELYDYVERYRRAYEAAQPDAFIRRREEHRQMLDAAKAGDTERVAAALTNQYVQVAVDVMAHIDPDYVPERLYVAAEVAGAPVARPG